MDLDTYLFLSIIKWECSWLVFYFVYLFWRQIDQNIQFKEKKKSILQSQWASTERLILMFSKCWNSFCRVCHFSNWKSCLCNIQQLKIPSDEAQGVEKKNKKAEHSAADICHPDLQAIKQGHWEMEHRGVPISTSPGWCFLEWGTRVLSKEKQWKSYNQQLAVGVWTKVCLKLNA